MKFKWMLAMAILLVCLMVTADASDVAKKVFIRNAIHEQALGNMMTLFRSLDIGEEVS
jgi:hypothetical protein